MPHPLPRLERWLIAVVAVHLCFLPWALGTVHVWSQTISACLAVAGFGLLLASEGRRQALLRFPLFWIGLAFLLYILIQALNPAWRYLEEGDLWWMTPIDHITWLPTGMDTPYEQASPWRSLVLYGSAFLTAMTVGRGLTRRRSLRILLTVLAINTALLVALGIAQKALGAREIFWSWEPPATYFVSSFIYRNHGGAYFNLLLALSLGFAFWNHDYGRRHHLKSTPSGVLILLTIATGLLVFFSASRAAIILMVVTVAAALAYVVKRLIRPRSGQSHPLLAVAAAAGFLGFAGLTLGMLNTEKVAQRFRELSIQYSDPLDSQRGQVAQATLEMIQGSPVTGWGAGSFRFYFPVYQQFYPEIRNNPQGRELRWQHAHDDYLELMSEVGAIGMAVLLAGLGTYAALLVRRRFLGNPLVIILLAGLLTTLLHAAVDFPFFNGAVLITWCALAMVALRWAGLEQEKRKLRATS